MKLKFTDPVGPGTPAWDAFDKALEAHARWRNTRDPELYKRYYNQRQYMRDLLIKHGEPIGPWLDALQSHKPPKRRGRKIRFDR